MGKGYIEKTIRNKGAKIDVRITKDSIVLNDGSTPPIFFTLDPKMHSPEDIELVNLLYYFNEF